MKLQLIFYMGYIYAKKTHYSCRLRVDIQPHFMSYVDLQGSLKLSVYSMEFGVTLCLCSRTTRTVTCNGSVEPEKRLVTMATVGVAEIKRHLISHARDK